MASVEHFSIPVDDIERARAFYAAVFDFSYDPWDAGRGELRTGGGIDGDLHVRGPVPHPTITVYVDDLDETLRALSEHGGDQVGDIEQLSESSAARFVYVRDSEGNIITLYARG